MAWCASDDLAGVALAPDDVRDFRRLQQVSGVVKGQDALEYWRSAPYVLELMESYQLKQKLLDRLQTTPRPRWSRRSAVLRSP